MADIDLSGEFEKISYKARTATADLKAASAKTKVQLDTDVTRARERATAAADEFKGKAETARDRASS